MLTPPADLDTEQLAQVVAEQFDAACGPPSFVAVGEDSWGFRLGELWISVRRDLRGHVPAAYEAAHELRGAGHEYVLAPLAGADGRIVRTVGGHPVVVFPYLQATPFDCFIPSPRECRRAGTALERLHRAEVSSALPTEDFRLSFADDLDHALALADGSGLDSGPYAQPLQRLLSAHGASIRAMREEFTALARICSQSTGTLVLTHGEPIASNVLRRGDDVMLGDWGDAMWAPPERDWSHVRRTLGTRPPCRAEFLRLYDVKWILSEIAEYVEVLAAPHAGDADDAAMWQRLLRYLPPSPAWDDHR